VTTLINNFNYGRHLRQATDSALAQDYPNLEIVVVDDGLPDNAFIEAFNGRFRADCVNAHWFLTLADAREKMEDWSKYHNEERPPGGDRPKAADYFDAAVLAAKR
jgi:glycosyltransferase involved in cell wall biosynthesis